MMDNLHLLNENKIESKTINFTKDDIDYTLKQSLDSESITFGINSMNDEEIYENKYTFDEITKINRYFIICESIKDVYDEICSLIENKKFNINLLNNDNNEMNLKFFLPSQKLKEIDFTLKMKNNKNNSEIIKLRKRIDNQDKVIREQNIRICNLEFMVSNTTSLIKSLEKKIKQLESLINLNIYNMIKNKDVKVKRYISFKKSNIKYNNSPENNYSEEDNNSNNFKNKIIEDNNSEEQINERDIDIKNNDNENNNNDKGNYIENKINLNEKNENNKLGKKKSNINNQLDCIIEEESSKINENNIIEEESNYNYISENNYEYVNMDYKNIENNSIECSNLEFTNYDENSIINEKEKNYEDYDNIDEEEETSEEYNEEKDIINKLKKIIGRKCNLELLYQMTRDGNRTIDFHKKVDIKGPTITLFYTQDGYSFGGYTSKSFKSNGGWVKDPDSFLFNFNNLSKFKIKNGTENEAIFYGNSSIYGPEFYDILINSGEIQVGKIYPANFINKIEDLKEGEGNFISKEVLVFRVNII